jgi:hypothetical protein
MTMACDHERQLDRGGFQKNAHRKSLLKSLVITMRAAALLRHRPKYYCN